MMNTNQIRQLLFVIAVLLFIKPFLNWFSGINSQFWWHVERLIDFFVANPIVTLLLLLFLIFKR